MYITYLQKPKATQLTFEDILFGYKSVSEMKNECVSHNGSTRTIVTERVPYKLTMMHDYNNMIDRLVAFNEKYEELRNDDRTKHYEHFTIPKRSGGLRPIDSPDKIMREASRELQAMLSGFMIADHHTNAYAYIPGRSVKNAVARHQRGITMIIKGEKKTFDSKWFAHFDFHGFFPSTTLDFIMNQFSKIYPFSVLVNKRGGREELRKALSLCMLRGGLPQGSPISPWITNVMMIPFDHFMATNLNNLKIGKYKYAFVYTRYADDIFVSCHYDFDYKIIESMIINELRNIGAPFYLNQEKTRYVNRAGSNWMLGMVLNKDNEITFGWRNRKQFEAIMHNYIMDKTKNDCTWPEQDLLEFRGRIEWYRSVNKDSLERLINEYNIKFHFDLISEIQKDLKWHRTTAF